jgi:hypothetical protein
LPLLNGLLPVKELPKLVDRLLPRSTEFTIEFSINNNPPIFRTIIF